MTSLHRTGQIHDVRVGMCVALPICFSLKSAYLHGRKDGSRHDEMPSVGQGYTMSGIRYLSLFSGIEAATVAWKPLGWEAVAFAQYEPGDSVQFPSQVLQYHYPDVPNLGDVTKITEEQIAALGHIDLVVGGSPCQDLSVAGKRAGLRDEDGNITRSGLFDYQIQIFEWARRNNGCRFLLFENVPGALSSNNGNDFAYILGSMAQRDVSVPREGWANSGICVSESGDRLIEYRILDAQYFRIAQRRRRVFALCDTGAWWSRPPILFESEGLQGNPKKSKGASQGASSAAGADSEGDVRGTAYGFYPQMKAGSQCFIEGIMPTLVNGTNPGFQNGILTTEETYAVTSGNHPEIGKDITPALKMRDYKDPNIVGYPDADTTYAVTTEMTPKVGNNIAPTLRNRDYKDPQIVGYPELYQDKVGALCRRDYKGVGNEYVEEGKCIVEKAVSLQTGHTKGNGCGINEDDVSYTLSSAEDAAVAYRLDPVSSNSMKSSNPNSGFHAEDVCCTLDTSDQNPVKNQGGMAIVEKVQRSLFDE